MNIATYTKGHGVFVPVGQSMLCIGSKEDVDGASTEELVEMIYKALRLHHFMAIASSVGRIVH